MREVLFLRRAHAVLGGRAVAASDELDVLSGRRAGGGVGGGEEGDGHGDEGELHVDEKRVLKE